MGHALPAIYCRHGGIAVRHRHRHHRRRPALPGIDGLGGLETDGPAAEFYRRRRAIGFGPFLAVRRRPGRYPRPALGDVPGRRPVQRQHPADRPGRRLHAAAAGPPAARHQRRLDRRRRAPVPGRMPARATARTRRGPVPAAADHRPGGRRPDRPAAGADGGNGHAGGASLAGSGPHRRHLHGQGPRLAQHLLGLLDAGPGVYHRRPAAGRIAALAGATGPHRTGAPVAAAHAPARRRRHRTARDARHAGKRGQSQRQGQGPAAEPPLRAALPARLPDPRLHAGDGHQFHPRVCRQHLEPGGPVGRLGQHGRRAIEGAERRDDGGGRAAGRPQGPQIPADAGHGRHRRLAAGGRAAVPQRRSAPGRRASRHRRPGTSRWPDPAARCAHLDGAGRGGRRHAAAADHRLRLRPLHQREKPAQRRPRAA